MSDRIRNLEDALQAIHSELASHPDHQQPHPLMQPALLGIKCTMGLYNAQTLEVPTQAAVEHKVMLPDFPNQVSNKFHRAKPSQRRRKTKKRHSKDDFSEAYFQSRDCTFKPTSSHYLTLLLLTTTSAE